LEKLLPFSGNFSILCLHPPSAVSLFYRFRRIIGSQAAC
jgi:hypothetical protein